MVRSSLSYNCRVLLECCRCSLLLQTVYTIHDGDIDYDLFPFLDFVSWFMPAYIFVILASRQRSQGMLLKLGMGKEEWVTGNWERECTAVYSGVRVYSGNPPENSEWRAKERKGIRNKRKCYGCKREFLPAVPPDDSNFLVGAQSDWYWAKQSMESRLGRKSNRYSQKLPHSVRPQSFFVCFVISSLFARELSCH